MITVHHLENSRSQRVLWLLEELNLEYEVKRYQRDPKVMLAPSLLKAVHPLGKAPVITDGVRTIAETGAIVEYLVERSGGGNLSPPADSDERLRYTYWLHYAEGSIMPWLLMKLVFDRLPRPPMPLPMRPFAKAIAAGVKAKLITPQIKLHLDYIETELGKNAWFAGGEFSAADIQMSFPLEGAAARGGLNDNHPHIRQFLERIHARPAYKRALERGGPFALLG
ncbi:MAG TPA: glutathione S-transferase [Gammaproteobacteria bacterium]|nr:glutathione S-transferase [Gammaproteobacteria bacterium]